ncbi:MAG: hypothetical protein M3Y74_13965 [Chloroflexota bacterium]|jgi:predicted transcriptional regulator|nr:hypothetical protein [Chloroflexota bacterium]
MASALNTSIRMGEDVRDLYETISQATGRTRNELMVEVLREEGQRRVREIAMIEEGIQQVRAGRTSSLEDVVARFKERGMLDADFDLDAEGDGDEAAVGA